MCIYMHKKSLNYASNMHNLYIICKKYKYINALNTFLKNTQAKIFFLNLQLESKRGNIELTVLPHALQYTFSFTKVISGISLIQDKVKVLFTLGIFKF
jgi:hypothetical protein